MTLPRLSPYFLGITIYAVFQGRGWSLWGCQEHCQAVFAPKDRVPISHKSAENCAPAREDGGLPDLRLKEKTGAIAARAHIDRIPRHHRRCEAPTASAWRTAARALQAMVRVPGSCPARSLSSMG